MQPFEPAPRFQGMSNAGIPGTQPENKPIEILSTTQARQAQSGLGVRYVLAISLSAALALMAVVYFIYAAP